MALVAGPPRRDENEAEVVALVRRRLCLVQPKPVHMPVWRRSLLGTPNCCLRARTSDSLEKRLLQAATLFSHQCLVEGFSEVPHSRGAIWQGSYVGYWRYVARCT